MMTIPGRMLIQAHSMIRPGGLCFLAVRLTLPYVSQLNFTVDRENIASFSLCQ